MDYYLENKGSQSTMKPNRLVFAAIIAPIPVSLFLPLVFGFVTFSLDWLSDPVVLEIIGFIVAYGYLSLFLAWLVGVFLLKRYGVLNRLTFLAVASISGGLVVWIAELIESAVYSEEPSFGLLGASIGAAMGGMVALSFILVAGTDALKRLGL